MMSKAPAPRCPINELQPGQRLDDQVFLVNQKDLRTTANGSLYIHAVLADGTGQLVARMWDATQGMFDSIPNGGFIRFTGRVESYKGKPQFIIDGLRAVREGEFDPTDFLPHTQRDTEEMWTRVKEIMRGVKDPNLLALIAQFINDEHFVDAFKRAPAAAALHHAYLGGLLEHTLNLLELAVLVLPRYPEVSPDLVLCGILLHDAGKTRELSFDTNIGYTNEGQLVGHIVMCAGWIQEKARAVEAETGKPFPADLLNVLTHIIVAHHGTYEFGSPKLPMVPEAIAVHYLDNLDAKLEMYRQRIADDADETSDWTQYIPALQTKLFKPKVMERK
ncbi:MAG: HD domain-containing protein [Phycisphaerae bacterium]|nr:HD domain-containing protein [Phycisphaerae bacterium]